MAEINEIIKRIEQYAPLSNAQQWDNPGWQINLGIKTVSKIMPVLDVTPAVIEEAAVKRCGLILSHHPVIFNPLKRIDNPVIIKAVQNNIQIYSAHTNLDAAKGGMTDFLARRCGFTDLYTAFDCVRYKKFGSSCSFAELILKLKTAFGLSHIKTVNPRRQSYGSIAFCSGSGGEFIPELEAAGIDVYITGDLKHHQALCALKMSVIDIGHYESERFAAELFAGLLRGIDAEIVKASEKAPWEMI